MNAGSGLTGRLGAGAVDFGAGEAGVGEDPGPLTVEVGPADGACDVATSGLGGG